MVYECRTFSIKKDNNDTLTTWKLTGIDNLSVDSDLKDIPDATSLLPSLDNNGRMNVKFSGNCFVQNKVLHPNNDKIFPEVPILGFERGKNICWLGQKF